jgi:hypothetical protein
MEIGGSFTEKREQNEMDWVENRPDGKSHRRATINQSKDTAERFVMKIRQREALVGADEVD